MQQRLTWLVVKSLINKGEVNQAATEMLIIKWIICIKRAQLEKELYLVFSFKNKTSQST